MPINVQEILTLLFLFSILATIIGKPFFKAVGVQEYFIESLTSMLSTHKVLPMVDVIRISNIVRIGTDE